MITGFWEDVTIKKNHAGQLFVTFCTELINSYSNYYAPYDRDNEWGKNLKTGND